ncbi:glutathione peroxidase [Fundicoccus ignavus]|uniref:Glutathione peroxidase n=1 Tax=Fundicoccus ignavus TaxID=2664442 RepID=A0A844BYQ1_9LACT|nr:glutathione peroxidase [Fundicoccus ignavus]MRJ46032.1 redoxin domain-containing protein [Fundicoccus ignavus]
MTLPDFTLIRSNGEPYTFNQYNDHVILIVNTATECGFAKQFDGLENLYQEFKDQKFVVLGFPSNQFNKQEPVSNEDMLETCRVNFGVTFPLNEKINVNGPDASPLFQWLKQEKRGILNSEIKWNFTKFLINREGEVVKRYPPTTEPKSIVKDIEKLL